MKVYLVNYANKLFYKRQEELNKSALKFGIDETISFKDKDIKQTEFYKRNKETLSHTRGAGYWVWKPYVILRVMKKIKEGDILFYVDSGAEVINNVKPLIDLCKKVGGILLFTTVNKNKYWTKRDCFVKMNLDSEKYWEGNQIMSGYEVYINNRRSRKFLKEWLYYVQLKDILTDAPSKKPDFEGFVEHRHDQSVLTNISLKYNIKGFRNPSQGGNYLKHPKIREKYEQLKYPYVYSEECDKESNYPTIFYNRRSSSKFKVLLIKLYVIFPRKLKLFIYKLLK